MEQPAGKKAEEQRKQNRIVYEAFNRDFRMKLNEISTFLGVNPNAASRIVNRAVDQGFVLLPQMRKRSYKNLKEYMYFVRCDYPYGSYKEYSKTIDVQYHAVMAGFANLWLVTTRKLSSKDDIVVKGPRSDYFVTIAPDHSWSTAVQKMHRKVEHFDPAEYTPRRYITSHWDESILWDSEDEILFREFKYNSRKPLTPVMRKTLISSRKTYEFIKRWSETCTVFTRYFPESILAYDPYLFVFETDYEDFIIELFSELPTSSVFFKVSNTLFLYANVDRSSVTKVGLYISDVSELQIPILIDTLLEKGILKKANDAIVKYYCRKEP